VTDQTNEVFITAIGAAILILVLVGVARVVMRRRSDANEFGAGGTSRVPVGTDGVAKTDLKPSGVVLAAGEQWTARSGSGARIASGEPIRVIDQDGLTLIVEAAPATGTAQQP
jgi:membrane-bound ClpP family serine protease